MQGIMTQQESVFKGTVSRDFRLLVFFMNQFPLSPWVYHKGCFEFFRKFAEIFTAQGDTVPLRRQILLFAVVATGSAPPPRLKKVAKASFRHTSIVKRKTKREKSRRCYHGLGWRLYIPTTTKKLGHPSIFFSHAKDIRFKFALVWTSSAVYCN